MDVDDSIKKREVPELKEQLSARGLSTAGKRDELVARLESTVSDAAVARPEVDALEAAAAPSDPVTMDDFSADLEPLMDLGPLMSDVLTADDGALAPPAKRQCSNSKKENRCSECGVPNKFTPKSGHTQKGWCPARQRFTTRSSGDQKGAGERLRDLDQNPEQAEHFLAAVRQGDAEQVQQKLQKCPELILVAAPGTAKRDPSRTMWSWSPLHAALHLVTPEADGADPMVQVVAALLLHCQKNSIHLTTLKLKSDTFASPLHEAAYRGKYLLLLHLVVSCCGSSGLQPSYVLAATINHMRQKMYRSAYLYI